MNPKVDWFRDQKWGVFNHYLYNVQNKPGENMNMGAGETSWDECVDALGVKLIADQLADVGAHYLFFTLQQGSRHLCAPNATYEAITGLKPGEGCSTRDLIAELSGALKKRGIALFLYYTGDGPHKDPVAGPAMGYWEQRQPLTDQFLKNWSSVAREYSLRYGEKISGWWVDGCYSFFHYDDEKLQYYKDAMRAGNPNALLAFNGGVESRVSYYSELDDYTCGEMNDFIDLPEARFINGVQWHTLAPLGLSRDGTEWGSWGTAGAKRDGTYMADYVRGVTERQGIVTIDIGLFRDGHYDSEQLKALKKLKDI